MKKRTLVCFLIFTLCVFYTSMPNTVFGQEEGVALAKQVFDEHSETLQRDDVKALLPQILEGLRGAGDDADIPGLVDTAITLINAGQGATLQTLAAAQGVTLTDDHITLLADADVQTLLTAETTKQLLGLKGAELQAGLAELLKLANEPVDEEETPPDDGTTPPDDGTTPPDDGTTPPDDGTTPPIVEPPDPEQPIVEPPGEEVPPASPFDPITPANESIYGKSRLGGLSLNKIFGRQFVEGLISVTNVEGHTPDTLVDLILSQVPSGLLSKSQMQSIRYALTLKSVSIFDNEADQLDFENFGNAITPKPVELGYLDVPNTKYLTRDNLNLYVRVPLPAANIGGVSFMLQDGHGNMSEERVVENSETVSHTFQLDESLAATNLPAWPTSSTGIFSDVTLHYSYERLGEYQMVPMMASGDTTGAVVWETEVEGIPLGGNVYYYFEVTLSEPVALDLLSRSKLLGLILSPPEDPNDLLEAIANATLDPPLEITRWRMPDPRNLQIVDRGITDALFTPEVNAAIDRFVNLPAVEKIVNGQNLSRSDSREIQKGLNRLQVPILASGAALLSKIESTTDPMLASVFTVPNVDPESESLWVVNIDSIPDNHYYLAATVHDAAGAPLDQIQEKFTVDTTAPEATVEFRHQDANGSDLNTTGYWNSSEGVYVTTAPDAAKPAALNVRGMPKYRLDPGESYLIFQEAELDADGNFQNTWMPLTIQSTMASSKILQAALSQNPALLRPYFPGFTDEQILGIIETVTPELILGILTPEFIQTGANEFLAQNDIPIQLDEYQSQVIHDILGFTFQLVDTLLPVSPISFDFPAEGYAMTMPIQGDGMPLAIGDYGIRALGLDTLFNINASAPHTRLRIVPPEYDKASVTFAVIGDCNLDGDMDDLFESGAIGDVTIFNNTTEGVMLTVTVDHRTAHPATVRVEYMDATGEWQNIGELDLDGTETGSMLEIPWNVADFDALLDGKEMGEVMVRAVATNDLRLTDPDPMVGTINLDAGICPLDPEVIAITLEPVEPTMTNPDSGGRQGMITLTAYTPSRTSTPISSVHLNATGPEEKEWVIEASEAVDHVEGQQLAGLLGDLVNTVGPDKPIVHVNSMYQKWMVTVDTTTLKDTITVDSPAARDHKLDKNKYVVTGYAVAEFPAIPGVEARFSVDNVDDVAPLGPTNISITSVEATDSTFESGDDGSSYTVGGLVDKYDEAVPSPMATLTIEPTADRATYESVKVMTDAENLVIGEAKETAENSGVFEVIVDVGTLADGETYLEDGTYMFHALAFDDADPVNVQDDMSETDGSKISVTVDNTYRPAPEILAIAVDSESITETNPDSGAPQGTITIHAYSHEISSPPTSSVRIEVKRLSDAEWMKIENVATESVATTEVSDANLADFVGGLANIAVDAAEAGESEAVPINRTYQRWAIEVDTTMLEDTITKDSPAARDASKDDNRYMVRAYAVAEADESETMSADGVTAHFSVDNVDDVSPVGPTNIVAVADVAGPIEASDDGSYTISNIVDDTLPSPIATFTTEPAADPATYELVKLVQTAPDGTETVTKGEAGVLDITIDIGVLENGTYMFHALAVDEFGNVQTDDSPMVTVHILNFRVSDITDLVVIAVDGTDVAEPPTELIPLRDSVTVSFMVANGSLAAEELSGEVNGGDVPSESAEDPENTFSLMVELKSPADSRPLSDGVYTPDGVVTKRNGSVRFPLTEVNLDNTGPMVVIESPTDGEAVDSLPTIHASYQDGAGAGVDGATGSLGLARLQPPDAVEVVVDQAALEKDAEDLVYTRTEQLAGGGYRVTVEVADILGNVGSGSQEFTVNGTLPTVAIHSPVSGQTFEHGKPPISGEFSGAGTVEITTFTINDVDATPEVDGNQFSYTPAEALADGNYKVVVAVTDGDGNMAQTSSVFAVEMPRDTTPPVISAVAPTGIIKDPDTGKAGSAKISAVVTDEQSAVSSVKYSVNGGQLRSIAKSNIVGGKIEAPIDFETHGPGLYNVRLVATSEGGTTEHTWSFTLVVDNVAPTITSITPSGTIRGGLPVISASANDESGVSKMTITVWDSDGKEMKGKTADDGESDVEGITRLDFNLEAPLDEGVYTIEVRATDPYSNSASAKETFSIDFDTAAPVITMASPQNEARLTNRRPLISIAYADAESGVDVDSIRFIFNSNVINLKPNQKTASQVLYRPEADLPFGQHTVKLEVSDMAQKEGNVSEKNKGAREANMAAYEFTFFVESVEGPILVARPINVPNPFKDETHISFALTRQSVVSIAIYDSTLRPVRVLMDNKVLDAGNYFGKDGGILWNGKSSGDGEDLARGIYFCQIIVGDGIEPEYAILKLALTR